MNNDHLKFISKLTYNLFHIPIFLFHKQNIIFEYSDKNSCSPLFNSMEDVLIFLTKFNETLKVPTFITTENLENFLLIKVGEQKILLIGPFLSFRLSEEMLLTMIHNLTKKSETRTLLLKYYQSLTIINSEKIIFIALQLYYMIYNEILKSEDIIFGRKAMNGNIFMEEPTIEMSERRLNLSFHNDLMVEKNILQFIKEGKKEEFIKAFRLGPKYEELGILSKKDQLRSIKNLGISFITIATRSAIEGGLHYEIAYTLSDLYIQNLEEIHNINSLETYIEDAVAEMTERVRLNKQLRYSKPINACLNFIFKNLYEEIKLSDLANLVNLHPNYLSFLFKQEVGKTLTEYIQQSKIEEAKTLLSFSDYSLSEISTMLNFHDQSHFSTVFKKITGISPRKYKNNN